VAGVRGQAGDLAVRWIPGGRFTMGSPSSEPDRDSEEAARGSTDSWVLPSGDGMHARAVGEGDGRESVAFQGD
jgi:hypothetical protein